VAIGRIGAGRNGIAGAGADGIAVISAILAPRTPGGRRRN
jgi:thiamine monophosphate synthase